MTSKNEPRREPSLADLEAFERLLRDSLKGESAEAASETSPPSQPAISAQSAMAEFNRLVEAPVVFEPPGEPPSVSRISAIEKALRADIDKPAAPEPAAPLPRDPLLDFEEELRRFEAMSRPPVPPPANPVEPVEPLRREYPGEAVTSAARAWTDPPPFAPHKTPVSASSSQGRSRATAPEPPPLPEAPEPDPHGALTAAEDRLSAEAEAAAFAGGAAMAAAAPASRSRGIFLALGGVALAGLAVIAGVTAFSGSKKQNSPGTSIPVVAAKPEPAKEKPANPGGLEVPDQNKQVLAARNTPAGESRPAQVVNQTEQPVDLNQIARRDSVRVVAPSPFSPAPSGNAPADTPSAVPTTPAGSAPATALTAGEPRRVQSVRIAEPTTPPPAVTPTPPAATPGIGAGSIAAIGAGAAAAIAARPTPAPPVQAIPPGAQAAIRPNVSPPPVIAPVTAPVTPPIPSAPPRIGTPAPESAPKAEARPQSPVTPPRPATSTPNRPATNAPLPLSNPSRPAATQRVATAPAQPAPASRPTTGESGSFAIQLASRPTEVDAQGAGRQLAQRFSGQIGGRAPVVVRGQANGQTVYRVRVNGFAQADAAAACDRIRAAGGACFVTRQ